MPHIATELETAIQGDGVILSPLRAGDADRLAGLLEEPHVARWLGASDAEQLRRRFAGWESRQSPAGDELWMNWVVAARSDGRALGWIQATVRAEAATVAYALLVAERGRGAAADAVRTLAGWLRERLDVSSLEAHIGETNLASQQVARAAGLRRTERRAGDEAVWALP